MGVGKSLYKKVRTVADTGVTPIVEGRANYDLNDKTIEQEALRRAGICTGCDLLADEPISFLRIEDERIAALSGKMCDDCGCASPYLLRQNSKKCSQW